MHLASERQRGRVKIVVRGKNETMESRRVVLLKILEGQTHSNGDLFGSSAKLVTTLSMCKEN